MKLLIIGEGGREHALCWKAAESAHVDKIFVAPGNAGTALESKTVNVAISVDDIDSLLLFAQENEIDLCIVGPELPLVMGISDRFNAAGIKCFGPEKAAAQLEGSKAFAKAFLIRHNIPTARYAHFTDLQAAITYIKQQNLPIVIKADGLAAGKGVIIAQSESEAVTTLEDILVDDKFGEAGAAVVIEEFLTGEEASFICMVAGSKVLPFASSQDHKAAYDGDKGPNTGGMGAYSPAPIVDSAMHTKIMEQIIVPTVNGLQADNIPYLGFLYAGLMIDDQGNPRVIEFNCRLGDPETQPILMRLQSDLIELCLDAINGNLPQEANWTDKITVGVVLAAEGYPEAYDKGHEIEIDTRMGEDGELKVFHAGTKAVDNKVVTSGGRVLCACAAGSTTIEAQALAYEAIKSINWQGMWYRKDIAYRAIAREQA